MLIEHEGKRPRVHETAWIAPTAVVSGDVVVGPDTRVLFGAVLSSEGGAVRVGEQCVVMENAVLRGTPGHPLEIGDRTLVGPHSHLSGCFVEDEVFLATGSSVFNGARIGRGAMVRINGTVHVKTHLPPEAIVPIGWVAVGDPVAILPPQDEEKIWERLEPLDFPREVFNTARSPDLMARVMASYTRGLGRHANDRVIDPPQAAP